MAAFDQNPYSRVNIPQVAFNKSSVMSGYDNPAIQNADWGKAFAPFWGPVENKDYLLNQDTTFKRNYQLPYAYPSKHLPYVSTVIYGLIIDTSDFLTRSPYGCPIEHTTDQVFEWNEITFDESTLDYVPEEGIPTILRSAETSQKATVSRRGKAILLEHGFAFSPRGQLHFVRQVQQISNAIALTLSESTLREMVRTRPKQMKYLADIGKFNKPTREILSHFYDNFAPCQRMNKGLANSVYDGINIIRDRGYSPNMLIIPSGGECFFNLQASDYNLNQFSGVDVRIPTGSDPYARVTSKFGLAILYTRSYKPNRAGAPLVDPLIRHRVYGEFFKSFQAPFSIMKPTEYRSYMRDVDVFDWNADRFGTISLKTMLDNWLAFDQNGFVYNTDPGNNPAIIDRRPIPRPEDGKMNNLFGTIDQNGWRMANMYGELVTDFVTDDLLLAQIEQLARIGQVGYNAESIFPTLVAAGAIPAAVDFVTLQEALAVFNTMAQQPPERGFLTPLIPGLAPGVVAPAGAAAGNVLINTSLSSTKTGPVSFGYLKQPAAAVTAAAPTIAAPLHPDQVHAENIARLTTLGVSPENVLKYGAVRNMKDVDQAAFAARSAEILSSNDINLVNEQLMAPVDALSAKKTPARATDLIATLTAPVKTYEVTVAATEPMATAPVYGLYPVTENFVPVSPNTLQEIAQPISLDLSTATGFLNFMDVAQHGKNLSVGAPLTVLPEAATRVALRRSLENKAEALPASYRFAMLYRKFIGRILQNAVGPANVPANAGDPVENNVIRWVIGCALLLCRLKKSFFHFLIDQDVYFPFNVIIARPWVTHQTATGVLGLGGAGLGKNFVGHEDTMWGDDANTKMHIVTFTMNHRTVIFNPLQITLRDDMWVRAYTGGANLEPFTVNALRTMKTQNFRAGTGRDRPSWTPIFVPSCRDVDDILDIRGRFEGMASNELLFITTQNHYDFFNNAQSNNNPMASNETPATTYNTAMVQGTQFCYNHVSKQNDAVIMGINHPLGADIYEGCRKDLERCAKPLTYQAYEQKPKYKIQK